VAVVSLHSGKTATAEEIRKFCSEKAPHYIVPREIHILADLPRTSSGKLDRSTLKRDYAGG
jgi:acyl-CoA synthetase (AMP-forming)/AMP-acid ligase II